MNKMILIFALFVFGSSAGWAEESFPGMGPNHGKGETLNCDDCLKPAPQMDLFADTNPDEAKKRACRLLKGSECTASELKSENKDGEQ